MHTTCTETGRVKRELCGRKRGKIFEASIVPDIKLVARDLYGCPIPWQTSQHIDALVSRLCEPIRATGARWS
ncbi:hypothetical protein OUZ56_024259 [Daphnia magna]|uniref:Uncharacterized protein n=1 Tax=Daphnia magna TaxID=35525 RepID=A0ABR0B144_9CRUS|nr:hypothetical protein OUZ56_024259 [Daphnia magna]